jgi:hypothetical protein
LVKNLIELLEKYNLRKKIPTYVKNKGFDLNIMITTLKLIASCEILDLEKSFERICFGHAFLKTCQYD